MTSPARADGLASAIVALNPHDHDLGPILDAWASQAGAGRYEVVIVNDGSRPTLDADYAHHRARHPSTPVRIVRSPVRGRAASNNLGVRVSRGDLLVFVADDFRPSLGLVAAHRRFHALLGRTAVGIGPGYFGARLRKDPYRRWLEDSGQLLGISFPIARYRWSDYYYVGNSSMPRAVFERSGGFDEAFGNDLFDDWEFGERLRAAGTEFCFVPRAIAAHDHEYTFPDRIAALRLLGECAAAYEPSMRGPPPWAALVALDERERESAARAAASHMPASASIAELRHRWVPEMHLAFLRGYQAAVAQRKPAADPVTRRQRAG
jgi:GT2 family glycosyltransferase